MKVHHYRTSGGKDLILDYINKLSKPESVDGLSVLEHFRNDELDKVRVKQWQGKVWEAYFYKDNRLFYFTVEDKNAYVLHACRKQKNKTEQTDKDLVIKRAKELGKTLNKKII